MKYRMPKIDRISAATMLTAIAFITFSSLGLATNFNSNACHEDRNLILSKKINNMQEAIFLSSRISYLGTNDEIEKNRNTVFGEYQEYWDKVDMNFRKIDAKCTALDDSIFGSVFFASLTNMLGILFGIFLGILISKQRYWSEIRR